MAATAAIGAAVGGVASAGVGIYDAVSGGSQTPNSGGTPATATGGQSANLLSGQQMGQAGNQYLQDAMGLQQYGQGYAQQFFPQVEQATQNAASNPYGAQAISGAQGAANYGLGTLAPGQSAAAGQVGGIASQYAPYISQYLQQASQPTAGSAYENQYLQQAATPQAGSQYLNQALGQATGSVVPQQYLNQLLAQSTAQTAGGQQAGQALATGFAPNNGLYNQQLQQTTDQSNAINAMYGLSQSPYGANLTDQAVQSFNNSFNLNQANLQSTAANTYDNLMNQQLSTQQQGLSGFNTLSGANLASQSQGLNTYTGLQNSNLASQTGNLNAYNSLAATDLNSTLGLGGLASSLGSGSGNLYGQASSLGQGAYSTLGTAGGLPATAYQGLANNSLSALGTGAQNANASLNPYTTYLNSLGNILGLGQVGQQNAAQQAQAGFGQSQTSGYNLGQSLAGLSGSNGQTSPLQTLWSSINGTNPLDPYTSNPYQIQANVGAPTYDPSQLPDLSAFNFG